MTNSGREELLGRGFIGDFNMEFENIMTPYGREVLFKHRFELRKVAVF